jgi:SAM-dependent methyltransferase
MSEIKELIRKHYGEIAEKSGCCGDGSTDAVVEAVLPAAAELRRAGQKAGGSCCGTTKPAAVVEGADLGLGCGAPVQLAGLRPGETVLDLGSGAGVDVFLAAREVGPTGRVIGVDMTPAMIERARGLAARERVAGVEFRLGDIEALPVEDGRVDVVVSNCVVNLAPDKKAVFAEILRVLKPGGRFVLSDMVTVGSVPAGVRRDAELWAGCIAGAMDREDYLALIRAAGFEDVSVPASVFYDAMKGDGWGLQSVTIQGRKPH